MTNLGTSRESTLPPTLIIPRHAAQVTGEITALAVYKCFLDHVARRTHLEAMFYAMHFCNSHRIERHHFCRLFPVIFEIHFRHAARSLVDNATDLAYHPERILHVAVVVYYLGVQVDSDTQGFSTSEADESVVSLGEFTLIQLHVISPKQGTGGTNNRCLAR